MLMHSKLYPVLVERSVNTYQKALRMVILYGLVVRMTATQESGIGIAVLQNELELWEQKEKLSDFVVLLPIEWEWFSNSRTRYSLEEYSEQQKKNWSTSKRIVIYDSPEQLLQFIEDSISNKTNDKKIYFGAIPTDLAKRIHTDTGVDVKNYNLSLGSCEIRKILKEHGNEEVESLRGQRAIVEDDFTHIVDIVLNPKIIRLSQEKYMGKPAIIFTGEQNGRMNVVAIVSDKRLDLFVQTAYVNKKRNLSTPISEQALINTPKANSGTVSNYSISQSFCNAIGNLRF